MLAHVIPIVVQMLPILLKPGPAHGIGNGQWPKFAWRNRVAKRNVIEIDRLLHGDSVLTSLTDRRGAPTQYFVIVLAEPRSTPQDSSSNACKRALRKVNCSELRMIDLDQKSACQQLRVIDEIERRGNRRRGKVAPLRFFYEKFSPNEAVPA